MGYCPYYCSLCNGEEDNGDGFVGNDFYGGQGNVCGECYEPMKNIAKIRQILNKHNRLVKYFKKSDDSSSKYESDESSSDSDSDESSSDSDSDEEENSIHYSSFDELESCRYDTRDLTQKISDKLFEIVKASFDKNKNKNDIVKDLDDALKSITLS